MLFKNNLCLEETKPKMIRSVVLTSVLLCLTLHCAQSKVIVCTRTPDVLVLNNEKHESAYRNYNDASKASKSFRKSHPIHTSSDKHVPFKRVIRSDKVTVDLNNTGVKKPNTRLHRNRTMSSEVVDQIHTFFSDKARENAYQKTEAQDHPYSVSYIFYNRKGDALGMCSGTLVTNSWVVSSAHCLVDKPVLSVKVFGGVTFNIFRPPKNLPRRSQVRTSYEFLTHPRYESYSDDADYDISLIKIDPPFVSNDFLRPIPMASAQWSYNGYRKCVLTAFGAVRDERMSPDDYIRKTQTLWVRKPCDCSAYLMGELGTGPVRRYVCMKPMRDFGICAGDSGGGLICDGELKAVASFSYKIDNLAKCQLKGISGSGECGDFDQLSVMQDVYPSISWIRKNALYLNKTNANEATNQRMSLITALFFFCSYWVTRVLDFNFGTFIS